MKINQALLVFFLVTIMVSSFSAITYALRNNHLPATIGMDHRNLFAISIPFVLAIEHNDRPPPLNQSTRMQIYSYVTNYPGIQFRGICNSLNLSIGVAQYHLGLLTKAGLLSIFLDGRYKRYFRSKKFTMGEMTVISLLRHQTAGKILSILWKRRQASHKELASQLSLSSQALTWQMNRLEKIGIVQREKDGMKTMYFLDEINSLTLRRCINLKKKAQT